MEELVEYINKGVLVSYKDGYFHWEYKGKVIASKKHRIYNLEFFSVDDFNDFVSYDRVNDRILLEVNYSDYDGLSQLFMDDYNTLIMEISVKKLISVLDKIPKVYALEIIYKTGRDIRLEQNTWFINEYELKKAVNIPKDVKFVYDKINRIFYDEEKQEYHLFTHITLENNETIDFEDTVSIFDYVDAAFQINSFNDVSKAILKTYKKLNDTSVNINQCMDISKVEKNIEMEPFYIAVHKTHVGRIYYRWFKKVKLQAIAKRSWNDPRMEKETMKIWYTYNQMEYVKVKMEVKTYEKMFIIKKDDARGAKLALKKLNDLEVAAIVLNGLKQQTDMVVDEVKEDVDNTIRKIQDKAEKEINDLKERLEEVMSSAREMQDINALLREQITECRSEMLDKQEEIDSLKLEIERHNDDIEIFQSQLIDLDDPFIPDPPSKIVPSIEAIKNIPPPPPPPPLVQTTEIVQEVMDEVEDVTDVVEQMDENTNEAIDDSKQDLFAEIRKGNFRLRKPNEAPPVEKEETIEDALANAIKNRRRMMNLEYYIQGLEQGRWFKSYLHNPKRDCHMCGNSINHMCTHCEKRGYCSQICAKNNWENGKHNN